MLTNPSHHTHHLVADESLVLAKQESEQTKKLTKQEFIDKYGIKISLPTYYIQSARFYPKNRDYYLVWENHAFPHNIEVYNLSQDGKDTHRNTDYEDSMKKMRSVIVLWKEHDNELKKEKEVHLGEYGKGLFKFSNSGNLIALMGKTSTELFIYDSSDIIQMMENIRDSKYLNSYRNRQFRDIQKIYFSQDDQIIGLMFAKQVLLYKIHETGANQGPIKSYTIPKLYSELLNMRIFNNGADVLICCKRDGWRNIDAFFINRQSEKDYRPIRYSTFQEGVKLNVKISKDTETIFLNTGKESIVLKGKQQYILPWFGIKHVHKMVPFEDGFIGVACKGYDIEIDLVHTTKPDFKYHIPRKQVPGLNKFFDMKCHGDDIKILSARDEEFFLDVLNAKTGEIETHRTCSYNCYGFQWPYLAFISQNRDILIFNAFKVNQVLKVSLRLEADDESDEQIICLDFSSNMNLFYATKQNDQYKMYLVDLDNFRTSEAPIFKWTASDVNNQFLTSINIRSSSAKESVDYNLETVALILHTYELYVWSEEKGLQKLQNIEPMSDVSGADEHIYYWKVDDENVIERIVIDYSSYTVDEVYKETDPFTKLKNYELDNTDNIYLLNRYKNGNVKKYFLKIYNLKTKTVEYKIQVKNKDVIGQFLSGNFYILNGIFYFQSTIIKVNFPNIIGKGEELQENVFQSYDNILNLGGGQQIPYLCPIATFAFRRMLYLVKDSKRFSYKQGNILPFLDERRVYFDTKDFITQFCTIVEDEESLLYPKQIMQISPYENRMTTYSLKGEQLVNLKYDNLALKYGVPVISSHNGVHFIFRKPETMLYSTITFTPEGPVFVQEYDLAQEYANNSKLRSYFSAFDFDPSTENGLQVEVQINDQLDVMFQVSKHSERFFDQSAIGNLSVIYPGAGKSVSAIVGFDEEEEYDEVGVRFFLFFKGRKNLDSLLKDSSFSTEDLLKPIGSLSGFKLSRTQVFFWSATHVHYCSLRTLELKALSLSIREEDSIVNTIKAVETSGTNENRCIIRMTQSEKTDSFIFWNMETNIEQDSFACSSQAMIFFDKLGQDYILDEDYITMVRMSGRVNSYKVADSEFSKQYLFKGLSFGHRVDPEFMSYLVIRNFMAIPCSYFNLIFLEQHKNGSYNDSNFDIDGLCYIINQQNELHSLVINSESLEYVLNKYEEIDSKLLEGLLFLDKDAKSPIHAAIESKSNKSINILLSKLAKLNLNNSGNLRGIFDDLLDFHSFQDYLNKLFFQSIQMQSIQTLKMGSDETSMVIPHNSSYLDKNFYEKMGMGQTSPVSQVPGANLAANTLNMQQKKVNRPVIVQAMDVWWILNYPQGIEFLIKLSQTDNVGFVTAGSSKIIIAYMWQHYSKRILLYLLIPYLVYFIVFILLINQNEKYFSESTSNSYNYQGSEMAQAMALSAINIVFIIYFFYVIIRRIIFLKVNYFYGMWAWLDMTSAILNTVIVCSGLSQGGIRKIRQMESLATILMWMKFLYFFRILESTAPLVRMIQEIFGDIRAFVVMFFMAIFMMANAFYVIGKNQTQFDQEWFEANPDGFLRYESFMDAIKFVYLTVIGEFQYSAFESGPDKPFLWAFFFITTFYVLIVLLNALIAIMGATFERVKEIQEGSMLRERVQMIMENQFLPALRNVVTTKYLISIQAMQEENPQDQLLNKISDQITDEFKNLRRDLQIIT